MIITESQMYWITRLDYLLSALHTINVLCIIASIVCAFFTIICYIDKGGIKYRKILTCLSILFVICAMVSGTVKILIPTTNEIIVIKVVPVIANSSLIQERVPKEAEELYKVVKEYLKSKVEVKK